MVAVDERLINVEGRNKMFDIRIFWIPLCFDVTMKGIKEKTMRIDSNHNGRGRVHSICLLFLAGLLLVSRLIGCVDGDDSSSTDTQPDSGQETVYTPTLPNERPKEDIIYTTVLEEFSIVNSAGNSIYGYIRRPDPEIYPTLSFAAVVKVPGGISPGRTEVFSPEVVALAEAGMVVVCFNAEGRVDERTEEDIASEGEEDYNGFRNQDTLAEIFEFVTELPFVIQDNIGIRTQSYGITMGAGCAAMHPELPIKYLVDGEGPPSSFVTVHEPWAMFSPPEHPFHYKYETVYEILGHYSTSRDPSPENLSFWEEREAIAFIGDFNGMYLRLQAEWDHSQPPNLPSEVDLFHKPPIWWQGKHTCDIVNAAVDGGVPWVRVNLDVQGNMVNEKYDENNLPVFLPGELKDDPMIPVQAVLEMARLEPVIRN